MRLVLAAALIVVAGCTPQRPSEAAAPEPAGAASVARSGGAGPILAFPLACEIGRTCEVQHYVDRDPGPGVRDYHCGRRTYEGHKGVDIRLPDMAAQRAGVSVLAAAPGRVTRLRDGVADISIRAPGAPAVEGQECGNGVVIDHGDGWETQYCHLARGSVRVKAGDQVLAGQAIARVGLSGNTEFPHLHLTVRHAGEVVDPFAPDMTPDDGCAPQAALWNADALATMRYKPGAVLNTGFAGGPVDMTQVEEGGIAPPTAASPYLVAYARGIELEAGDRVALTLTAPDGTVLAENELAPLDRDKAQHIFYVGKKRPAAGWSPGVYRAAYRVRRDGRTVIEKSFVLGL